jgi:uncharacterized membrane protein
MINASIGDTEMGESNAGMLMPDSENKDEQSHLQEQIKLIARHEQEFVHRRTRSERVGDALGSVIGSLWFVAAHACWIALWIVINVSPATHHFDPSPFPLLDTVVAIEAIFIASLIMMRQSRMSRRADERDHLILQILILAEREITAVLGIERQLASRLGLHKVAADEQLDQFSQDTPIDDISQKLQEHLTDS